MRIIKFIIKMKKDKKLFYRPIYNLDLIKLETSKTYIKIHLMTKFIQLSKSFGNTFILFDKKVK